MRFKIEIESSINTVEQLDALNQLVMHIKRDDTRSLKDLHFCLFSNKDYDTLIHGLSGSHFWVSCKFTGERILLITKL